MYETDSLQIFMLLAAVAVDSSQAVSAICAVTAAWWTPTEIFTARWLHVSCILTQRLLSKLFDSSVTSVPLDSFQFDLGSLDFYSTYTCVFHQTGETGVFPALQQPWGSFSALLKGSLAATVDASDLIPGGWQMPVSSQLGLQLPLGTRNWSSSVSAACQPPSLPANHI